MNIIKLISLYIFSLISFLVIDVIWLGFLAKGIYNKYLGKLMAPAVNWPAAFIFYFLFIIGLLYFSVIPALKQNNINLAIIKGILFGLFTYMTYELTNYAVIKDWPINIVIIDIIWGIILTLSVSLISYYFGYLIKM